MQQPPTELGDDQQAWSARLLLHHVKQEYDIEYHENYAYELLREADPEKKAEFQETVEKTARTERENRRCRRSIHQARWNRPAAWLVPRSVQIRR
ncbi:hypothetical protein [Halocatena marina]|uniref:Uncharacterized protein n=1 Tax=Halocatena marina TaxID=2934937 RepID=A0ABD5YVK2_9EURY|nr:hypothetical protein [Halocatena marina]